MKLFSKLLNSKEKNDDKEVVQEVKEKEESDISKIVDTANYMLTDVKKEDIEKNSFSININQIMDLGNNLASLVNKLTDATNNKGKNKKNNNNNLLKITNLANKNGFNNQNCYNSLKENEPATIDLKKVKLAPITEIDPMELIIVAILLKIENDLGEIKDISNKILSFLEEDKQSEIEADLKTLNLIVKEFKYNWQDNNYLVSNHINVLNIKKNATKNINFYKKQINDNMESNPILTTGQMLDVMQNNLKKSFTYYRMSLYNYAYATFLEIILLGNYQKDYLLSKSNELILLNDDYNIDYEKTYKYIERNANKSIAGNVLEGIGSAGKVLGTLAEKVSIAKEKNVDDWINKNSDYLKKIGKNIKSDVTNNFEELKNSNIDMLINDIDIANKICNEVKNIYFDDEKIYLEYEKN